jgi:L-fuculose-phosphate aldolase
MGDRKQFIVNEIVKYSQKLDQKNFGANHDGNISALFDNSLLATPTSVSKGNVNADMVITLDMDGNKVAGIGKPFSEIKLHLLAYKNRKNVNAVVHAHPPFATARGLVGLSLKPFLPEAIISLGALIPVAAFFMPGSKEGDGVITDLLLEYDAFMIAGNGVLAIGDSVEQAYLRLELVEHLAKIHYYAEKMGTPTPILGDNIARLLEKRAAAGLGAKALMKAEKPQVPQVSQTTMQELIKNIIKNEIKNADIIK